jgi:AcrR family transcriptional regulator
MQRVAERLDCAVGTLYLYFPSKAALVAALQGDAIDTLRGSFESALVGWDSYLTESDLDDELCTLVRLTGFGAHWASASVVFADEFQLQRSLLSERVTIEAADEVRDVLPVLLGLLGHPEQLLVDGTDLGALSPGEAHERALLWIGAMNGVLLLDNLAPIDRHLFRAQHLARELTHGLLVGWGASRDAVEVAASHVERLAAMGPLAPPP